jgi:hypothetical protein
MRDESLSQRADASTAAPRGRTLFGLRITIIAALVMLVIQIALGFAVAQAVNLRSPSRSTPPSGCS